MRTIRSQVWKRKLDRTKPNLRSNEWVPTVAVSERLIPPEVIRDFERIVASVASKKSLQDN